MKNLNEKIENKVSKKRTSKAFGKKVYLMGKDKSDSVLWLEHASWDCSWYWGFGYLEEYTQRWNPEKAKDIQMHTHVDCQLLKVDKENIFNAFSDPVFSEAEGLQLTELFKEFYDLRKKADKFRRNAKKEAKRMEINEILMPEIFSKIYKILSPE